MRNAVVWAGLLATGVVGMASSAFAGVITVVNPSFESPDVDSTPPFFNAPGPVTGWTIGTTTGNIGVWAPAHYPPSYTPPDGVQVAYIGYGYGILYQDVGPATAGETYNLSVEVGARTGIYLGDYRLLLGIGGHDLATSNIFAAVTDPVAPGDGLFALAQLSGVAPADGDLMIFLEGGQDAQGFNGQVGFDDVGVTSGSGNSTESVPEPISLSLFGAGLVGLGAMRRRKSKA